VDQKDWVWAFHFDRERITVHDSLARPVKEFYLPGIIHGSEFAFDLDNQAWLASEEGLVLIHPDGFIRSFGTADGLPSSRVSSVSIDKKGRLWVGTDQGLASWDGKSFKVHSSDWVLKVRPDDWGDIWTLTPNSLHRYRPSTGEWRDYPPGPNSLVPAPLYTDLYLDRSKGYLLVGSGAGLSRFDYYDTEPSPGLDSVEIYPNPFVSGIHHRVTIEHLPSDAQIRIYTLTGEVIGDAPIICEKGLGYFDPPNDLASGIYLIVISSPRGKRVVKLALLR
jgi:hypothetical protein